MSSFFFGGFRCIEEVAAEGPEPIAAPIHPTVEALIRHRLGEALGGGVTRSLALDAHGKSLSSALMGLEVEGPAEDGYAPAA